jgi:hypothetical protein
MTVALSYGGHTSYTETVELIQSCTDFVATRFFERRMELVVIESNKQV